LLDRVNTPQLDDIVLDKVIKIQKLLTSYLSAGMRGNVVTDCVSQIAMTTV